jgi:D-tyrosyl-tRNA(Tyr) deacylase
MRAVAQRVSSASVSIESEGSRVTTGSIGDGLVVFLGVGVGDGDADAEYLADKIANLRIFMDSDGRMNLSLLDLGYKVLAISQFTLYADARKGRRPSFSDAAGNEEARRLYERFCAALAAAGVPVETGRFREVMRIECVNEGPITILLDSKKTF